MRTPLSLALLALPTLALAQPTRGPYVQMTTKDASTIAWRTAAPSLGRVVYGLAPDALDLAVSATAAATRHELRLTGLEPGTRYCYAVEDASGRLAGGDAGHCFTTAPAGPAPFTFWVVGDSGTGSGKQGRVRDAMWIERQGDLPDVYIHVGDMAYSSGTDDEFQRKFFQMYPRLLARVPTYPAIGNHEGNSSDSLTASGPYYDAYALPTRGESGGLASGTEAYYAWDWGDVHFVALESHRGELRAEDGAMLTWLEMDLEATDKTWTVVYFHHPPYTKGSHDSDTEIAHVEMRERVMPILEAHGVDLVLGGHSHIYERSFLVHGAYDTPTTRAGHVVDEGDGKGEAPYYRAVGEDGAIYIVAGHGGTNVGRDGDSEHPLMYFTELANGSVLVDVDGATMRVRNVRLDGEVTDDFRFVKGEALHLTGPAGRVAVGDSVEITWISRGAARAVDLAYSTDDGATWTDIGRGLEDTGRYGWTVPDAPGQTAIFRVQDAGAPALSHVSRRPLEIEASETVTLVPFGADWRFSVDEPTPDWSTPAFDDRRWPREAASFGVCGCLPWEAGTTTFMADAIDTKTAYFRTRFTPEAPVAQLDLTVVAESGVLVYLDGQEVLRRNVDADRHGAGATAKGVEVYSVRLPGPLDTTEHTLAVAVKKAEREGVNLTFDLQLRAVTGSEAEASGCGCRAAAGPEGLVCSVAVVAVLALAGRRRRQRARRKASTRSRSSLDSSV